MQQNRLNGLLLLFVHKDIELDYTSIIAKYSSKHPRRMLLLNPLLLHCAPTLSECSVDDDTQSDI